MCINQQFDSGNFNNWEKLIKETFPKINNTIRHTILDSLDSILNSMLGPNSDWTRKNIDVFQTFKDNVISGVNCVITYTVDDFKVSNAPKEAIESDCEAIKENLEKDCFTIKDIQINTSSGDLTLTLELLIEDNDD